MNQYRYALLAACVGTAAVVGAALQFAGLTAGGASILGMIAAVVWVQSTDQVSKQFRTREEKEFYPPDMQAVSMGILVLMTMAAGVIGGATKSAMLGAASGVTALALLAGIKRL